MLRAFLLLFGLLFVFGRQDADKDQYRRLLLNDPDVIGNRLAHLESTLLTVSQNLQSVTSSLTDLQTKYTHQEGVIVTVQNELAAEKAQHIRDIQNLQNHGSTYIRWGRDDCSTQNTELIYKGYAAGEKYYYSSAYRGGASNMLCLPDNPDLSNTTGGGSSYIYGTEFNDNYLIAGAVNEDVSCASCRSTNTSSSVMFPGRKTCYTGWKEEYNGIIMSSSYSHSSSPYICVDAHPIYVNGGQRSNDEHLLYVTNLKCGSIPCPPYTDNVHVNCVVCSK